MLTKQEKEKIREEEIFRQEVRQDLQRRNSSSKVWHFFNSALGIWVLSTIVMGLLSWSYAKGEDHRKERLEFQAAIKKLDSENIARLDFMSSALEDEYLDEIRFGDIVTFPYRKAESEGVFSELQKNSARSLVLQLYALVPGNEKKEIRKALEAIEILRKLESLYPQRSGIAVDPDKVHKAKEIVTRELKIGRWSVK